MSKIKEDKEETKKTIKQEEEIPTFTPPEAPIFTPPEDGEEENELRCYHHDTERAVSQCAHCGKYICKDCAETFAVNSGKFANQHLCYDCCQSLFKEQEEGLRKNKKQIVTQYVLTIIGVVIGVALGASDGLVPALIFAMIGGVFLSALKPMLSAMWDIFKGIFELASGGGAGAIIGNFLSGIFKFLVVIVSSTIGTVSKLIKYTIYLIKASKALKETQEALAKIEEFMQYMEVRMKNKSVDLDSLMQEGSELYDNSYAQALRDNGEAAADAILAQATTTIAENGEIIRAFVA